MARLIFGDTSAIVAKLLDTERHHDVVNEALREVLREGRRILTTDYIFDEVVTRIRSLAGHGPSVEAGRYVLESTVVDLLEIDGALRDAAWIKYQKYRDHAFSFTDCTSFAVMEKYKVKEAFTLDSDFAKVGYRMVPDSRR